MTIIGIDKLNVIFHFNLILKLLFKYIYLIWILAALIPYERLRPIYLS